MDKHVRLYIQGICTCNLITLPPVRVQSIEMNKSVRLSTHITSKIPCTNFTILTSQLHASIVHAVHLTQVTVRPNS